MNHELIRLTTDKPRWCVVAIINGAPLVREYTDPPYKQPPTSVVYYEVPPGVKLLRVWWPESAARIEMVEAQLEGTNQWLVLQWVRNNGGTAPSSTIEAQAPAAASSEPQCRCRSVLNGHENDCAYAAARRLL